MKKIIAIIILSSFLFSTNIKINITNDSISLYRQYIYRQIEAKKKKEKRKTIIIYAITMPITSFFLGFGIYSCSKGTHKPIGR